MPQFWPVALNASGGTPTRGIEAELVLPRPDVGAVAVHHERQIAEQRHAVRVRAGLLPLRRRPATAGTDGSRTSSRELAARIDRARRARGAAAPSGHSVQRGSSSLRVNRPEQRVVVEPPRLLARETPRRRRARAVSRRHSSATNRSKAARSAVLFSARTAGVVDRATRAGPRRAAARSPSTSDASPPTAANSGTRAHAM